MGLYMASFMTLAIGTAVTPQFITQQCESGDPSEYESTFLAGQSLLCKDSCACYYTNSQNYTSAGNKPSK